jgi:UDP-N-acetylglucosamine--N-acetylmuramyl-(pentapeptide) pyrophosphoryl-undecaprenol N-acetylglucosamine transferase
MIRKRNSEIKRVKMGRKVIIGGGGTGGHVFPAISIADALKEASPGIEILFVGAIDRIEMQKVPEAGYKIIGLPITGLKRKFSLEIFGLIYRLIKSMKISIKIIRDFRPDVAVGVGGYASGPIIRAAALRGVPVLIQEQNSYAGITNKILAGLAVRIFVAYDGMEKYFPADKILLTGNPVRKDILTLKAGKDESLRFFNLSGQNRTILVLGGSLGAGTINRCIMNGLGEIPENIQLIWQTGRNYYSRAVENAPVTPGSRVFITAFINRMDMAYSAADIIISRSGAGTISELAVVGKPVILVPSPNVAEDHQTKNALSLVQKNAAVLVHDRDAESSLLKEAIMLLNDEKRREELSENIKKLAISDSAERIAREILKMIRE